MVLVLLTDLILSKWVIISIAAFVLISVWIRAKFSYWKNRKVAYLNPKLPWGNAENVFTSNKSIGMIYLEFYEKMKKLGVKYAGFYMTTSPVFVPIHPEMIKTILIKDFNKFHGRGFYHNEKDQPMSANLFTVDGAKWRTLRYKFSPAFSSGKIKYMYKLVEECAVALKHMVSEYAREERPINAKNLLSRFTIDSIGSCAFGIKLNSFTENPETHQIANSLIEESTTILRFGLQTAFPNICRALGMGLFLDKYISHFRNIITDSYEKRKNNVVYRTDFLQLMKDIQDKKNGEDFDLSLQEIQAQSFIFLLGGFETSSTAMTYLFLEVAQNQEIQDKLRKEIIETEKKFGGLTYEALNAMKYLECVINETLRIYPPLTVLNRQCTENYELPNGEIIDKGTNVIIPILALQRDPEYFPNPDLFDPERFSEENKHHIVPYTYFPFGDGPRNCIGSRFGYIQMKVAVSHLIKTFRFTVNPNMDLEKKYTSNFVLTMEQDVLLNVETILN